MVPNIQFCAGTLYLIFLSTCNQTLSFPLAEKYLDNWIWKPMIPFFNTKWNTVSPFWPEGWKGQKFDSAALFMPENPLLRDHNKIQKNKFFCKLPVKLLQFMIAKTSKIEVWKHESNSITAAMQCAFQRHDKALLQYLTPQKYPGKGERFQKNNQLISINSTFPLFVYLLQSSSQH